MKVRRAVVLVPTFNEIDSIEKLIERLGSIRESLRALSPGDSIDLYMVVIDDNSPDQTADFVEKLNRDWITVIRRPTKLGLGPAYIAGFRWALDRDFEFVVEMDADLSHQPEELPQLLKPVISGEADLTIGTRWMPGGKVVNWPLVRQLISRVGTGYARVALGLKLRDVTSGYRVFRRDVLERIHFDEIEAHGYGFQIEMVIKTLGNGFRIKEVPITFVEREGGVSKMSRRIVLEALWKVTIWGLERIRYRR